MAKIAVGGIQHETNVFAPYQAGYEAFEQRDEWPPLSRGRQMLENLHGMNLPVSGAMERLQTLGHEIVPLLWCSATPSAHVTEDSFERIAVVTDVGWISKLAEGVSLAMSGRLRVFPLAEVENAISRDSSLQGQYEAIQGAERDAAAAYELSFEQYQRGLVSYATVLESQRRAFDSQSTVIDLRNRLLQNRITLYNALGGEFGVVDEVAIQ